MSTDRRGSDRNTTGWSRRVGVLERRHDDTRAIVVERRGKMVPVERSLRSYVAMDGSKFLRRPGETHEETMARLAAYDSADFDKRRAEWTRECVGEFKPTERRQSTRLNMTDFHRRETDKHRRDAQCDELQAAAGDRLRKDLEAYARGFGEKVYDRDGAALRRDLEKFAKGFRRFDASPYLAKAPAYPVIDGTPMTDKGPAHDSEEYFKERTAARIYNKEFGAIPPKALNPKHQHIVDAAHAEFQQARLKTIALDLKRDINQLFDHVIEGPYKRTNNAGEAYVVLGLRGPVGSEQQLFDSILAMCKVLRLCGMLAIKPDGEVPATMRPCPVLYWRRDPEFTYEEPFDGEAPYIKVTVRLVASQVLSAGKFVDTEKRCGYERRDPLVNMAFGRRVAPRRRA